MAKSDLELLQAYTAAGAQEAFAELVRRHLGLVYSTALRQVRSPSLAEEVSQVVFVELAQQGARIQSGQSLSGWLYQVAHRRAIDTVRKESRRQNREQIALQDLQNPSPSSAWARIEPLLDEAMATLADADRTSVLLRFFENKSLREVGEALGSSEDAAQKRVSRAVDQLRIFFSRRGVTVGAAGLATAISANAVQSAPLALASVISAAGISAGTVAAAGAAKLLAMTTIHKTLIASVIAVGVGTGIYQAHHAALLQEQIRNLSRQSTTGQEKDLARLRGENDRLKNQLNALQVRAKQLAEAKIAEAGDPAQKELLAWLTRRELLRERLRRNPTLGIPEMKELTEKDWIEVAKRSQLETEEGFLWALSNLRGIAEERFARKISKALRKYKKANNGAFPGDVLQLGPYFEQHLDLSALQRWQPAPADSPIFAFTRIGHPVITERQMIDAERDRRFAIDDLFVFPIESQVFDPTWKAFLSVQNAFAAANQRGTTNYAELWPYATTPEQKFALDKKIRREKEKDYHGAGYRGLE